MNLQDYFGTNTSFGLFITILVIFILSVLIILIYIFSSRKFPDENPLLSVQTYIIFAILITLLVVVIFIASDLGNKLEYNVGESVFMTIDKLYKTKSLNRNGLFIIYKDKSHDESNETTENSNITLSISINDTDMSSDENFTNILINNLNEDTFKLYKNYVVGHIHLEKTKSDVHPTLTITLDNIIVYSEKLDNIVNMENVLDEYTIEFKISEGDGNHDYNIAVPTKTKWPYTSKESNLILYKLK
tara:strand:+ start:1005 stop:1739 length:735 start_codon:yes stop_codon:yes gene_type:complete